MVAGYDTGEPPASAEIIIGPRYALRLHAKMKSVNTNSKHLAFLSLLLLPTIACLADDKSCESLMDSTPECKNFATPAQCEAILRRSAECKDVPGVAQIGCMLAIGHLMEQYFACEENSNAAADCKTIIDKVAKFANKLDEAVGCRLQDTNKAR